MLTEYPRRCLLLTVIAPPGPPEIKMLKKLISGGQTGADRAALDAGLALAFAVGGFCPKNRQAEDGPLDPSYPLVEIKGGYRQRTKANVEAADGTVMFYESILYGGTQQTLLFCIKASKPYKLIDISLVDADTAVKAIQGFVDQFAIEVLNMAGPRASSSSSMYDYVRAVTAGVIRCDRHVDG